MSSIGSNEWDTRCQNDLPGHIGAGRTDLDQGLAASGEDRGTARATARTSYLEHQEAKMIPPSLAFEIGWALYAFVSAVIIMRAMRKRAAATAATAVTAATAATAAPRMYYPDGCHASDRRGLGEVLSHLS
jgi:hypothetical protein